MNKIWLSIGSNIDKENNIRQSISILREKFTIDVISSIYDTSKINADKTIDLNKNKSFWNFVCLINTKYTYKESLLIIKNMETYMGRNKTIDKYYDRIIDIDILLFNDEIIKLNDKIVVPHKDLGECFYIDIPLVEVCNDLVHPLIKKKIKDIVNLNKYKNIIRKIIFPY